MAGENIDEACKELDRGAELLRVLWKDLEHIWRTLRCVVFLGWEGDVVCRFLHNEQHTQEYKNSIGQVSAAHAATCSTIAHRTHCVARYFMHVLLHALVHYHPSCSIKHDTHY